MHICPECHVALLAPHPELVWWHKCPVCGFCAFEPEKIHPSRREAALRDPYLRIYSIKNDR